MKKILTSIIFVFVLISESFACDCIHEKMEINFKEADFVVTAKMHVIKDLQYNNIKSTFHYILNPDYVKSGGYFVEFKTQKTLKGTVPSKFTITPDWSNCDYFFKKGKSYVIFGYKNSEGKYKTNICTSTFLKRNSEKYEELKNILEQTKDNQNKEPHTQKGSNSSFKSI